MTLFEKKYRGAPLFVEDYFGDSLNSRLMDTKSNIGTKCYVKPSTYLLRVSYFYLRIPTNTLIILLTILFYATKMTKLIFLNQGAVLT